ncbi:sigma-70 family RNA polymerase sigma factor [Colwellia sp. BRX10-3]|uniref:RNA polymerase sigma factor n=1 Tax=Colwellia sp. BRX10-3 TaxID=2759844 RepID=UPI0015F5E4FE|nr:sigma-70 family RNA polymerase sigma factor [Colwellia sp. BRX10-3]MBA6389607.1 sigma-70 family RNA polymerase sigma factor [Colwellia sp. BRX10-3]
MNNPVELVIQKQDCFKTAKHKLGYSLSNQEIFINWISEHEKLLRHIINGFEAVPAIQEELFQEIALNIWRALPSFRADSAAKTFIARIAHNVLATHVAKAVKTVKTEQDFQSVDSIQSSNEAVGHDTSVCPQLTPYQSLDQNQRQQRLAQAIRQLKLEQQQVITLALEGMSYQDIADVLAISTNLVGVRLQRAKAKLMQLLEAV